jgi:hypothetical protein
MSADTSSVLASIDDTLAGYDGSVSGEGGDAMRWSPQRVICGGGKPLAISARPAATIESIIRITLDTSRFEAAMRELGRAFTRMTFAAAKAVPSIEALAHVLLMPDRKHRVRCRACNPAGNPPPLAVDGREYRRRQKARQRRNR